MRKISYTVLTARVSGTELRIKPAHHVGTTQMYQKAEFLMAHLVKKTVYIYILCVAVRIKTNLE